MCRNFLWGAMDVKRKLHLCKWENICQHKSIGGFGLRYTKQSNLALLSKVGWGLVTNYNELLVRVSPFQASWVTLQIHCLGWYGDGSEWRESRSSDGNWPMRLYQRNTFDFQGTSLKTLIVNIVWVRSTKSSRLPFEIVPSLMISSIVLCTLLTRLPFSRQHFTIGCWQTQRVTIQTREMIGHIFFYLMCITCGKFTRKKSLISKPHP